MRGRQSTPRKKARVLRAMPSLEVSADGQAVEFSLATDTVTSRFAVHPAALPEIIFRLMGGLGEANRRATQGLGSLSPVSVHSYQVGGQRSQNLVLLSLSPEPGCWLEFCFSPQAAQDISSGLAAAAATIAPRNPRSSS